MNFDYPFELREGRIWVDSVVNGALKAGILDTGADGTGIDEALAKELGLRRGKDQTATITAGKIVVAKTDPIVFGLGNGTLTAEDANILQLSTHFKALDFILGFDALRKVPFSIDYRESLLHFGSMPKGVAAQFVVDKDIRPTAELSVAGARIPAILDTGSGTGITFPDSWARKNIAGFPLADPQRRTILGNAYISQRFVLDDLSLAGIRFAAVDGQAIAAEKGTFGDQVPDLAEIGNPVLRMFGEIGIDGERRTIAFAR